VAGAGVSLGGLGLMAAGAILAWSGVNDPPGGPVAVLRDVLQGKMPTAGGQVSTAPVGAIAVGSAAGQAAGAVGGSLVGSAVGAAIAAAGGGRGQVVAVARQYLDVPYRWAGSSKSGIDCSGLVMVAYRDGAGINLPHLATAQMAKGKRIDRSQIMPGDLVGWGVPGNYPHIALAIDANTVIVAPHTGTVVQIQSLWEKKVPGFGYPDIVRI
jgi:cell wall-associated NlpC family hydrolase